MPQFEIIGDFEIFNKLSAAAIQAAANALQVESMHIVKDARNFIAKNTGVTSQNINFDIEIRENEINAKVGLLNVNAAIGLYLEYGTRPHFPPLEAIQKWVHQKQITGSYSIKTHRRVGGKAHISSEDYTMAYLIARKMARVGTSPKPWLNPAVVMNLGRTQEFLNAEINKMRIK